MAYGKDKINEVRKRYVFDRLSLEQVAQLSGVSYPTCQRWKNQAKEKGDDWDKVRTAHTLAGGEIEDIGRQILTDFIIEFKATMTVVREDAELTSSERVSLLTSLSDSYNKAISANKKIIPEVSKLAVALQTVELLGSYIQENKPEAMAVFVEILVPFGEMLDKELK